MFAGQLSDRLDILGIHFKRGVLINQADGKYETQTVLFPHESAFQTLHRSASDSYSLAQSKVAIRFEAVSARLRPEKIDVSVGYGNWPLCPPDEPEHARRAEHKPSIRRTYMDKYIGREKRLYNLLSLPVLPNMLGFERG